MSALSTISSRPAGAKNASKSTPAKIPVTFEKHGAPDGRRHRYALGDSAESAHNQRGPLVRRLCREERPARARGRSVDLRAALGGLPGFEEFAVVKKTFLRSLRLRALEACGHLLIATNLTRVGPFQFKEQQFFSTNELEAMTAYVRTGP